MEQLGESLTNAALVLWFAMGIVGALWLVYKGYFSWVKDLGCMAWILGGWLGLIILLVIVMTGGGILLLIAWRMPNRPRCPYCHQRINQKAIKCPYCQADLTVAPPSTVPAGGGQGF